MSQSSDDNWRFGVIPLSDIEGAAQMIYQDLAHALATCDALATTDEPGKKQLALTARSGLIPLLASLARDRPPDTALDDGDADFSPLAALRRAGLT
jgi:hypothetical protein